MSSPAEHVLAILRQAPAVSPTTGNWIGKVSRFVLTPDQQIVVFDSGARSPEVKLLLDEPTVMVQVRGAKDGYSAAFAKCQEVKDRLLGIDAQTMGNGDRIDGILPMGDINFLQYDESDRPMFSINFRMYLEPVASALTHRSSL